LLRRLRPSRATGGVTGLADQSATTLNKTDEWATNLDSTTADPDHDELQDGAHT
jgi:hypothetical protein